MEHLLDPFSRVISCGSVCRGCRRAGAASAEYHSRISDRLEMFDEMMGVLDRGIYARQYALLLLAPPPFSRIARFVRQYRGDRGQSPGSEDIVNAAITYYMKENLDRTAPSWARVVSYVGYIRCRSFPTPLPTPQVRAYDVCQSAPRINKACSLP